VLALKLNQIKISTLLIIVNYLAASTVFSQTQLPQQTNLEPKTYKRQQTAGNTPKHNENIQQLKQPLELPNLPTYSGKARFMRGYTQTTEAGYTTYQMNFLAKEDMGQVKNWYQNTFNIYQWKMQHAGQQNLVAKHDDGHICTIVVNPTVEPGYHTQLNIYYTEAPTKN